MKKIQEITIDGHITFNVGKEISKKGATEDAEPVIMGVVKKITVLGDTAKIHQEDGAILTYKGYKMVIYSI